MIVRQGDVLVMSTDQIPGNATEVNRDDEHVVLAYGEVTGHAHRIIDKQVSLFESPDTDDRFLRIMNTNGAMLRHEEHATIYFPPGEYIVRIQREYTSADMPAIRVLD